MMEALKASDPKIFRTIEAEIERINVKLELIASENFTSQAVLEAMGQVMTNKYAEGYPKKRYYGGCENVDEAEKLARVRAKKLYGAEHANVQPHSGAQANMAVQLNFLKPGDTVLGMDLSHGGHLTHGHPLNFSGKYFNIVAYGVNRETEMIDYDELMAMAKQHKPKMIIAGASAYYRAIDFKRFREIADEVGAYLMTDMAHWAGLIAVGEFPDPIPHSHAVTTTTHKTLRGPRGGLILCPNDYAKAIDKAVFPGIQGGPLMHVIAAKAVAFREAQQDEFKAYQIQVKKNAKALARALEGHGFRIVSGDTDAHMFLVDLTSKNVTGKQAEESLDLAAITVNKNTIPFDQNPPLVASGIRLGTPALTTRGMKEPEMERVAELITRVIHDIEGEQTRKEVEEAVRELCKGYPIYDFKF